MSSELEKVIERAEMTLLPLKDKHVKIKTDGETKLNLMLNRYANGYYLDVYLNGFCYGHHNEKPLYDLQSAMQTYFDVMSKMQRRISADLPVIELTGDRGFRLILE